MRSVAHGSDRAAALAPIAERFAPTETFESDHTLRVGGLEVELRHRGPGHTDGDVVVVVPSEGIVAAADLVYVGLQPFIDVGAGGRTDEWLRRIDELLALCGELEKSGRPAVVVPGHGGAVDWRGVAAQRGYFERLYEAVSGATQGDNRAPRWCDFLPPGLPAERAQLLGVNLGLVYDEMNQAASFGEFSCPPE